MMKKYIYLTLFFSGLFFNAYAQEVVTGVVKDATGQTIPGATVVIKGTSKYVSSDLDGKFSIAALKDFPFTLQINITGYQQQEIDIYELSDEPAEIILKTANVLDEVVVIGYGTQKKGDITGSVSSVPQLALKQPISSFDRALQGAAAGVQVTQVSGQPGAAVSIRIRGGNSITGGNEPLYVIDGFPVYNSNGDASAGVTAGPSINALASLNPSDIESIEVLKDASATAIYGSRGANGVVLITTKKGKAGQNTLTYDAYYGTQQVLKKIDVMTNAKDWAILKNEARANSGKAPYYTQDQINGLGEGTDWQDAAFRSASIQNHQISMTGGDDKTRYAISGNYFKQKGVLLNTDFERYSGRVNLERDFSEKFKVGVNLTASKISAQVANAGVVNALLAMPPAVNIRDASGKYTYQSEFETPLGNPIATLEKEINYTETYRFLGNAYGEYAFFDGLVAKVSFGTDIINNKQNRFIPSDIYQGANSNPTGKAYVGSKFASTWLNENTLSYSKTINDKHSLNVVVGYTQQAFETESAIAGSQAFITDQLSYNDLASGSVYTQPESGSSAWALNSYLGRINYSIDQKYIFTVSGRADGSSRFGKDKKWGYFPSAAFAWNISKEDFLSSYKTISNLKVRLSAGVTGNQEIGQYLSLATLGSNTYFFGGQTYVGFAPNRIANPDLGWETTAQYDAGIDLSLYKNRINFVFDAYLKKTTNLLLNVPIPYTSGQTTALQNYGSVENKGIELGINTENLTGPFSWNTNFVFSVNRNKVLTLGDGADYIISGANIAQVGQPLGTFYGYQTNGLFQTGDDIANLPTINPATTKPGDRRYIDINGDGKITQADDRTFIGNAQPKFQGGITNTLSYLNFDLSIFFQGTYGNKVFNQNKQQLELLTGQQNASVTAYERWTPTNPTNDVQRAFEDPAPVNTSRYVEDGSFLRLKNITLGYNLPKNIAAKIHSNQIKVYVSAANVFTWTKYTGFDPEVSRNEQSTLNQGIDYSIYPSSKSFLAGLSISF
ncbi:SusC/RagA family TonB-linked outer membrane protein [Dyadobacter psychrophilus]|uniref:TonB-linked outer membrane protein, SusC/RagA family n=1 Tax=Dyadobacter psychrophilus TaxID=651661 RepID=A0A1T5DTF8_9BACT|nr:TonB-dependent receptor [Dyadobacter psychrophilus]SKB74859.1 TonB-linked outer membrane protein, SusC/RagA family [Dyadobacter psychrophilus]